MAGRPRERALALELDQRTRLYFEDDEHTVLDFVCAWLADGKTLRALGNELSDKVNLDLTYDHIMRYLGKHFDRDEVRARLAEAREQGAYALADDAIEDALGLACKDDAPIVRVRNDARHWTAQRWNRRELGESKPGVNVTLNVGTLHLDAMRQRNVEAARTPALPAALHARSSLVGGATDGLADGGSAIADAIVIDPADVSIEES